MNWRCDCIFKLLKNVYEFIWCVDYVCWEFLHAWVLFQCAPAALHLWSCRFLILSTACFYLVHSINRALQRNPKEQQVAYSNRTTEIGYVISPPLFLHHVQAVSVWVCVCCADDRTLEEDTACWKFSCSEVIAKQSALRNLINTWERPVVTDLLVSD